MNDTLREKGSRSAARNAELQPIDYDAHPIRFIDQLVTRHKAWVARRSTSSEALRYMREAVDQVGRGRDFMSFLVHSDAPEHPDPHDPRTDLALLQIYDHWRSYRGWKPIEPWDGSRLRPWLPPENNPRVPDLLKGDLAHFRDAWSRFHPDGPSAEPYQWDPLDALGIEAELYFSEIRSHATWSRPVGGGKLRFYRFNELNNLEVAPYSIRFWGFLKWLDVLRRTLDGKDVQHVYENAGSDITFMDEFNKNHFPWHDDVFGKGKCEDVFNQFGLQQRHKHAMNTYGYALEFIEFHGDLIKKYNEWLNSESMPPTEDWHPGVHDSAHVLKLAFEGPWGIGNTNGSVLPIEEWAPELTDPQLRAFPTGATLGYYLENCGVRYHGIGHVQHCDIRDVYTNNYSIRFFGWHQWIDSLYRKILSSGRPKYDESIPLDQPLPGFCGEQQPMPEIVQPFEGSWVYRSFHNTPDPDEDPGWFVATMHLQSYPGRAPSGRPTTLVSGELDSGHPDYRYRIEGYVDKDNINYEAKPRWHDERSILVMTAHGMTEATRGHEYGYRGTYQAPWPDSVDQTPTFSGMMARVVRPDDPSLEGKVGTFHAVRQSDSLSFFSDGLYTVPEGVTKLRAVLWGAGGGGGADGPGMGAGDGAPGGDSAIERLAEPVSGEWVWDGVNGWMVSGLEEALRLSGASEGTGVLAVAGGGQGGTHGVSQPSRGGEGGTAKLGHNDIPGQAGEDGGAIDGQSGKGGDSPKAVKAGLGGERVGQHASGRDGLAPGGGGAGAQEAHTPGAGGGAGAYTSIEFAVRTGETYLIRVGQGGAGGDGGFRSGGDGAPGMVSLDVS